MCTVASPTQGIIQDLRSLIDSPVNFTTPAGSLSISPDPATIFPAFRVSDSSPQFAYVRSADVTSLVQQGGSGTYSCGGVVAAINQNGNPQQNCSGWTLYVFYENPAEPFRNMTFSVANDVNVTPDTSPVTVDVTGFSTPASGTVSGSILVSAFEGDSGPFDPNFGSDELLFGPNAGSLTPLSTPNNPVDNFFQSQINTDEGTLDTGGTFGTLNTPISAPRVFPSRYGYDQTGADISALLTNNQTTATVGLTSGVGATGPGGDQYWLSALCLCIEVSAPTLELVKSADVQDATIGETINYTIVVTNTGNGATSSTTITDPIPAGTTFVPGSVTVNGVPQPSGDPATGIEVGPLLPGQSATVTFQVTVTAINSPAQIVNTAVANCLFPTVPGGPIVPCTPVPDTSIVPEFECELTLVKSADRSSTVVNDVVTYTVQATNTGTTTLENVTIVDDPRQGAEFIPNTVTVNGVSTPGANPFTGVNVGTLLPNQTSTMTYQMRVTFVPTPPQLVNTAEANYICVTPGGRRVPETTPSNEVIIPVLAPDLQGVKTSDLTGAKVGDTVTYTIRLTNSGTGPALNVVINDPIPAGTQFVPGTITVNGVAKPAAQPSMIDVGTIQVGAAAVISLQVLVVSVPNPPQAVNQPTGTFTPPSPPPPQPPAPPQPIPPIPPNVIPILDPKLDLVKRASETVANVGDKVTYTIEATNSGNITLKNIIITDQPPAGTTFIPGSVTVDGVPQPAANPSVGINIGSLNPGQKASVTFQVSVKAEAVDTTLINRASATFTPDVPGQTFPPQSTQSNLVEIPVVEEEE